MTICEAAEAAIKAGSGEIVVGGESKPPNPVSEGLSLDILCDRDARPVFTARSGGAMSNCAGVYESGKCSLAIALSNLSFMARQLVYS